jgi:hypothetical protein
VGGWSIAWRVSLGAALTLLVLAVAAALVLTSGEAYTVRVQAVAAAVQAGTALIIVVLTAQLAFSAAEALAASRRQVAETQRANDELVLDRQLSAMPTLRVSAPGPPGRTAEDDHLFDLRVENASSHPALSVVAILRSGQWDGVSPLHGPAGREPLLKQSRIDAVAPGERVDYRLRIPPGDMPEAFIVGVQYEGLLGGRAWHSFQARRRGEEWQRGMFWDPVQLYLQPSGAGASPIIHNASDGNG